MPLRKLAMETTNSIARAFGLPNIFSPRDKATNLPATAQARKCLETPVQHMRTKRKVPPTATGPYAQFDDSRPPRPVTYEVGSGDSKKHKGAYEVRDEIVIDRGNGVPLEQTGRLEIDRIDLETKITTLQVTLEEERRKASETTGDLRRQLDAKETEAENLRKKLEDLNVEYEKKAAAATAAEGSLKRSEEKRRERRRDLEELESRYKDIQGKCFQKDEELKQHKAKLESHRKDVNYLQKKNDTLQKKNLEMEAQLVEKSLSLQKKDDKIVALTSRATMFKPQEVAYFPGQLGALHSNLTQWANRYYRTKYTIDFEELPEDLKSILHTIAEDPARVFGTLKASALRAQIVCGAVAHVLTTWWYWFSPFLGTAALNKKIRGLKDDFLGSAKDMQCWTSFTSSLASNHPEFATRQSEDVRTLAETLQNLLEPLADKAMGHISSEQFEGLLKILTHFASILLASAQQDKIVRLEIVECKGQLQDGTTRLTTFDPQFMEAVGGYEEDEELVERHATVKIVEFPGLLYVHFNDDGECVENPVMISKVKVSC